MYIYTGLSFHVFVLRFELIGNVEITLALGSGIFNEQRLIAIK